MIFSNSDVSRSFLGRPVHKSNLRRFTPLRFVPLDTLKVYSLALSVLRCLFKTFSELLKLKQFPKTLLCGRYLKDSSIKMKNLYGYKLVRAARSDLSLKDAESRINEITRSSVNYLHKRKSD